MLIEGDKWYEKKEIKSRGGYGSRVISNRRVFRSVIITLKGSVYEEKGFFNRLHDRSMIYYVV